uniref:Uncharacterized protein n=1 Tax=Stomoxys calcitrans TaxID=35570 RepID=A0A1I8QA25_STOCA
MVDNKSLWYLTILLLTFCFMLVHCTSLEPSDQFLDNPTDGKSDLLTMQKRPSFFVGSRYGRSSGGAASSSGGSAYAPSKTRRLNVVPRNDRFFLGSRYGKRAEISTGTQLSNKPGPQIFANDNFSGDTSESGVASSPFYMSCVYTGLQNFYRCDSIDDNMFYVKNTVKNDAGYENDDEDTDVDTGNDNNDFDENGNGESDDTNDEVPSAGTNVAGVGANALTALVNEAGIHNEQAGNAKN